jgi:hypothetical protein
LILLTATPHNQHIGEEIEAEELSQALHTLLISPEALQRSNNRFEMIPVPFDPNKSPGSKDTTHPDDLSCTTDDLCSPTGSPRNMENDLYVDHRDQTRPTGECKNFSAHKSLSSKPVFEGPSDTFAKPQTAEGMRGIYEIQNQDYEHPSQSEGPNQYISHSRRQCFARKTALESQQQDCIERAQKLQLGAPGSQQYDPGQGNCQKTK